MKYNPDEIEHIYRASQVAGQALKFLGSHVKPGVTTRQLDELAADFFYQHGATSASYGYKKKNHPPFPGHICTSVNNEICHGIPGDRVLKEGDIISLDTACVLNGWFGDTCGTFAVGEISAFHKHLIDSTRDCMLAGIEAVKPGNHVGDIGHAIYTLACRRGLPVVRDYVGHGVGRNFHEEPPIPHVGHPGTGPKLEVGMVFTIEPMINLGDERTRLLEDRWTAVTYNNMPAAQFEHTVTVTENGVAILTEVD